MTKEPKLQPVSDPTLSLSAIGDKLGETHATAVDIRTRLQTMKINNEINIAKISKELNEAVEVFNKSMEETLVQLHKLIGVE